MRRQGNEASPSAIHTSSIALLQERFRNRAGSVSALNLGLQAANSNEQPRWFLHPDLVRPSRPLHGPAYHGLGANGAQASPPPEASSWGDVPRMQSSGYRGDVDVDTSLHL